MHCEYCGRNFNQTAAERHIPFCKEQNGRRGTSINVGNECLVQLKILFSENKGQFHWSNSYVKKPGNFRAIFKNNYF